MARQEFGDAPNFLFWNDHRRFAPEFNHFGDGLGVPLAKFPDYWVFILFLRFQFESDSGWAVRNTSRARPSSRDKYILRIKWRYRSPSPRIRTPSSRDKPAPRGIEK